ncbi:type II toxin-antitoxin system prevent-host-death family antitoxin [Propionimicrobium sp. PCR01-08-3]|uniref:type II toxin-antitoxin system Phd/YefM family antitoxin n=1 Tax=Propionimicrobium sp. PCR01-08-3 TaxID=3052086 RepID=UPI00255C44AE|nr:type II toxin-antitoxin system prevent-host-death family antitoxin [Propionimicrobium sp. PCR01-08-3]WIY82288.1 type II toxin-antitoxin system prevent-host-death family antitoxin [Propionimicrobium sp. PCR01-08-3]
MSITVNVQEAKTRPSELLHRAEAGEEVVIARAGKAVVRIEPVTPRQRDFSRPALPGLPSFDESQFLDPMPEDELRSWEQGHGDDPLTTRIAPEGGAR